MQGLIVLVIISIAAAHVRLDIFSRHISFYQKLACSNQAIKKQPACMQNDIQREGSNKKQKQTSSLFTKIYATKLQILAIFSDPQNIVPLKIPCLI